MELDLLGKFTSTLESPVARKKNLVPFLIHALAVGHFIHLFGYQTTVNRSLDSLSSTVKLLHTQLTTTEGRGAEFGQQKFAMARRARRGGARLV